MKIKNFFISIILVFGVFLKHTHYNHAESDSTFFEEKKITKISVLGNNYTDANVIIQLSGLTANMIIYPQSSTISKAIHRIWDHDIVDGVNISLKDLGDNCVEAIIQINELPRLEEVNIIGIDKKYADSIKENLNLLKEQPISKSYIDFAKKQIIKELEKNDFIDIVIDSSTETSPNNASFAILTLNVSAKKCTYVYKYEFNGVDPNLVLKMKSKINFNKEKARFTLVKNILKNIFTLNILKPNGPLFRKFCLADVIDFYNDNVVFFSTSFDRHKLDEDIASIMTVLLENGFINARVEKIKLLHNSQAELTSINIDFFQGNQYKIGTISWIGNRLYSTNILKSLLGVKSGSVYNPIQIKDNLSNIMLDYGVASLYYNNGYLAYSANILETGLNDNYVDLEIQISENEIYTIKDIEIEGNTITHDNIINRELYTIPGEKFSGNNFKRSYRQLVMTQLFDPALPIVPVVHQEEKNVTMVYKVKESPKIGFQLSGSYGAHGLEMGLELSTNNASMADIFRRRIPLGSAQNFGISYKFNGDDYHQFSLSISDPMLSEKNPYRISFSTAILKYNIYEKLSESNSENSDNNTESSDVDDIKKKRKKLGNSILFRNSFSIGKNIKSIDFASIRFGVSYEYNQYNGKHSLLNKSKEIEGVLQEISFYSIFDINSKDNPIFPTKGYQFTVTLTATPPYSFFDESQKFNSDLDIDSIKFAEYNKIIFDMSYNKSILGKFVAVYQGSLGLLGSYQKSIGPFSRFSLGGTSPAINANILGIDHFNLRSYANGSLTKKSSETNYYGAVVCYKIFTELRYPVIESGILHLSLLSFFEFGNCWADYEKISILDLYKSLGVGIRLYVGLVLNTIVEFSFGYPLDYKGKSKDPGMVFQFSVGISR